MPSLWSQPSLHSFFYLGKQLIQSSTQLKTYPPPPTPILRLKAALVSGGLIRSDPPYEKIVDPDLSKIG